MKNSKIFLSFYYCVNLFIVLQRLIFPHSRMGHNKNLIVTFWWFLLSRIPEADGWLLPCSVSASKIILQDKKYLFNTLIVGSVSLFFFSFPNYTWAYTFLKDFNFILLQNVVKSFMIAKLYQLHCFIKL